VNLGANLRWDRFSVNVHELVYGPCSEWENDGGDTNGTPMFYKTEIGTTPITNLELQFQAMDKVAFTVGATNVFDEKPPKRNDALRAAQFAAGDNGAVAAYPSFSPFGINGAYYYGKLDFRF
jgi:iron complex outermembrane receptor protein